MLALEELRQVMSTPHHVPRDYDTDTVSVTSTVSDNEDFYTPTGIIAEAPGEERPYLIAWKDYPISQCTWEPPYHLDGTSLIEDWNEIKQELGSRAFEELNLKNRIDFEQAQDDAAWAQQLKLEKREKKRQRLKQRNRRIVHDEDSSDDEPVVRVRAKNDLFVGTQETQPSRSSSPLTKTTPPRGCPVARKAPLEQSFSDSDAPLTPQKQLGSSTTGPKPKQAQPTIQQAQPTIQQSQPKFRQPQPQTKQPQPKIKKTKPIEKRSTSTINFINEPKVKQHREWSANHQYTKLKYRGLAEKKSHVEGTPDFSALSFPFAVPQPATSRSNDDVHARRETTNRRVHEDDPYARREISNRRVQEDDSYARRETTSHRAQEGQSVPLADWELNKAQLMCYQFYHQLPCPGGDKYNCRFMHRELDPQGKPYPLGNPNGSINPKYRNPPVTCLFSLKGECKKSAEECIYAHNNTGWTEFQGRVMEIKHLNPNLITKPKDRDPPLICPYWLKGDRCNKSAEDCIYAHMDTGSTDKGIPTGIKHPPPKPTDDGRIKPKDRDPPVICRRGDECPFSVEDCLFAHKDTGRNDKELPTEITHPPSKLTAFTDSIPSRVLPREHKKITCHYWLRDPEGCCKDDEVCKHAHRNTGWATPGANPKTQPVRIDPTLKPRGVPPKYAKPPVTCPYWLRSAWSCTRSQAECKYAHWNTGWVPPGLAQGKAVPINPKQRLVYLKNEESTSRLAPTRLNDDAGPAQAEHRTAPSGPQSANDGLSWYRKTVPTETSLQTTQDRPTTRPSPPPYITDHSDNTAVGTFTDAAMDAAPASRQNHVQGPVAMQDAPQNKTPAFLRSSELRSRIESLWNLNFVEMFNSGRPGDIGILKRHAALLYSPQDHPQEIELITRWLLMYDVKVNNLWHDGAWSKFQEDVVKDKSGVIIAHPDFVHYIDLPGFGKLLTQDVRVWSVGVQPPWYEVGVGPVPTELQHDRINIFPHGGFIYITDDVFEHTPQLALKIISLFFDKIEQLRKFDSPVFPWLEVPDAFLVWRICVRPELMEYLYLKCIDNEAELAAENPDIKSYFDLYMLLHVKSCIEQDCTPEPLTMIPDKYPIMSERREIAQLPSLDYFNVLAKSQEDANTSMIGYYAALQSNDLRRHYRNFYVVHTQPDANCAQHWKDTIHNISDVITPERCAEELEKPSKDSLFDFLDWAMEPKEKGDGAGARSDDGSMGDAAMDISPVRGRKEGRHTS